MPALPNCGPSGRKTLLADLSTGAADVAGEAASALAAASALLQATDAPLATDALTASKALYDFARKNTKTASSWALQVARTYPTTSGPVHRLWAAAMLAWIHRCGSPGSLVVCDAALSTAYYNEALALWADVKVHFSPRLSATIINLPANCRSGPNP
jgi:hypothetical protein